jgi:hypothetical protein
MGERDQTTASATAARLHREATMADRNALNAATDDLTHPSDGSPTAKPLDERDIAEQAAQDEAERRALDEEQLDQGLRDSFPASDPVSITRPERGIGKLEPEEKS